MWYQKQWDVSVEWYLTFTELNSLCGRQSIDIGSQLQLNIVIGDDFEINIEHIRKWSMNSEKKMTFTFELIVVMSALQRYTLLDTKCILAPVNPLRTIFFFWGIINIYLHFMSFFHIDLTQVLKTLTQVRAYIFYIVNIMAGDILARLGARASAAMILT